MRKFVDKYMQSYGTKETRILDVGSQDINGSYKPLFDNRNWEYKGLDICQGENVDIVVKDIYNWKEVKSNSYDIVISGQALEHIEYFWLTMCEISRVLKNEGLCCIIAPSSGPEHRYPKDCWRFFPDGLEALAGYAMLEIVEAYTCWEPVRDGEENIWKDTVLVCRKPTRKLNERLIFFIRSSFLKLISIRTPLSILIGKVKR